MIKTRIAIPFIAALLIIMTPPMIISFADDSSKEEKKDEKKAKEEDKEPRKLSKEERAALIEKLKKARAPSTLLRRAQNKITEYTEDGPKVVASTILYGSDENANKDIKVFTECMDGSVVVYYANADPDHDVLFTLSKDDLKVLEDLLARQKYK